MSLTNLATAPATRADSPPPDRPAAHVIEDAGSRWRTWRWRCQCGKPVPGPFDPTFATAGEAAEAAVRHVTEHHPAPVMREPIRCTAKWLYRGRTRAKCYDMAGHEGRHWNGTVKWSDRTPGAVPPHPRSVSS